eukprot:TRINITY_DN14590_c0_g1_i1.p1 TRINITY_DN14590_c0_g1~~TRINITY_DN14590_c0_g1_i1.p1  ORF type:complete len:439 (+),score=57.69 TRINITY_DN14590_c0_g1_i1:49-1317(+)
MAGSVSEVDGCTDSPAHTPRKDSVFGNVHASLVLRPPPGPRHSVKRSDSCDITRERTVSFGVLEPTLATPQPTPVPTRQPVASATRHQQHSRTKDALEAEAALLNARVKVLEAQLEQCTATLDVANKRAVAAEAVYGVCRHFLHRAGGLLTSVPQAVKNDAAISAKSSFIRQSRRDSADKPSIIPAMPVSLEESSTVRLVETGLSVVLAALRRLAAHAVGKAGAGEDETGADMRAVHRRRQEAWRMKTLMSTASPNARPKSAPSVRQHRAEALQFLNPAFAAVSHKIDPSPRPVSAGGGWMGFGGGVGMRGHDAMAKISEQIIATGALENLCAGSPEAASPISSRAIGTPCAASAAGSETGSVRVGRMAIRSLQRAPSKGTGNYPDTGADRRQPSEGGVRPVAQRARAAVQRPQSAPPQRAV